VRTRRPPSRIRWALGAVVLLLAFLTFLFLRGPAFVQRYYYPLEHESAIRESAERHEINPYLVAAVVNAESGWDPDVVSDADAVGLMQVLPETAAEMRELGLVEASASDDLSDPATNIEYGTAYLRYLVERYHEIETALAAYNAGIANADDWAKQGGDIRDAIEFPETKHFVLRVARARDVYERLYPDAFE